MQTSVHRGPERYTTRASDRVTHHSFSFGEHYDPDNLAFGPMRCHDDHHLSWGAGFTDHPHSDVELVTWVLHGQLVHSDHTGEESRLPAGTIQVQSAGSGIRHSEVADTSSEPTRFVQTWLVPDEIDGPPARFVASGMGSDELVPVAGEGAPVPIGTAGATLWTARLLPGHVHELPVRPMHHLYIANGHATWRAEGHEPVALDAGDALRVIEADSAGTSLIVASPTDVVLWTFRSISAG